MLCRFERCGLKIEPRGRLEDPFAGGDVDMHQQGDLRNLIHNQRWAEGRVEETVLLSYDTFPYIFPFHF
jgi:hypothetical protein